MVGAKWLLDAKEHSNSRGSSCIGKLLNSIGLHTKYSALKSIEIIYKWGTSRNTSLFIHTSGSAGLVPDFYEREYCWLVEKWQRRRKPWWEKWCTLWRSLLYVTWMWGFWLYLYRFYWKYIISFFNVRNTK